MFGYLCAEFWLHWDLFSKALKGNWVIDMVLSNQKSQAVPATVS
jgi:hypothetical protein